MAAGNDARECHLDWIVGAHGTVAAIPRGVSPTIRYARPSDLPRVEALVAASGVVVGGKASDQVTLVLDAPDDREGLAAVCIVQLEHARSHVCALIVAPRGDHQAIEHRMLGVAEALADAMGAPCSDVRWGLAA